MGEIADMIIDGTLCQYCGGAMGDQKSPGYPRTCAYCRDTKALDEEGMKLLEEANSLLRSAHDIALRRGKHTDWNAWLATLRGVLVRQHRYMGSDGSVYSSDSPYAK